MASRKRLRGPWWATGAPILADIQALEVLAKTWRAHALSTEPVDACRAAEAVQRWYRCCGLPSPRVVVASGPLAMALAGGVAAAILFSWETGLRSAYDARFLDAGRQWGAFRREIRQNRGGPSGQRAAAFVERAILSVIDAEMLHIPRYERRWGESLDAHAEDFGRALAAPAVLCPPSDTAALLRESRRLILAILGGISDAGHVERLAHGRGEAASVILAALCKDFGHALDISPRLLEETAADWPSMLEGGSFCSAAAYRQEALREVFGVLRQYGPLQETWEACCRAGGPRLYHERFCIISDRPEYLQVDTVGFLRGESVGGHSGTLADGRNFGE